MKRNRDTSHLGSSLAPVYLFHGQEDFLIEESVQAVVAKALDEAARGFNYDVVDGSRTDGPSVVALASAYPMMSERRVVVVREFERLSSKESDVEALRRYFDNPLESTCLILIAREADLRKKVFVALREKARIVECKPLYEDKIPAWIETHIRELGKEPEPAAVMLLQEYVGNSLRALDSEIKKVLLFVGERPHITEDDVLAAVGASRGFTVFDLERAIGTRKLRTCFKIIRVMLHGGQKATPVVSSLARFFTKLWKLTDPEIASLSDERLATELGTHRFYVSQYKQYRRVFTLDEIERAFGILRELDTMLKSTSTDEAISLELALHGILKRSPEHAGQGTEATIIP